MLSTSGPKSSKWVYRCSVVTYLSSGWGYSLRNVGKSSTWCRNPILDGEMKDIKSLLLGQHAEFLPKCGPISMVAIILRLVGHTFQSYTRFIFYP